MKNSKYRNKDKYFILIDELLIDLTRSHNSGILHELLSLPKVQKILDDDNKLLTYLYKEAIQYSRINTFKFLLYKTKIRLPDFENNQLNVYIMKECLKPKVITLDKMTGLILKSLPSREKLGDYNIELDLDAIIGAECLTSEELAYIVLIDSYHKICKISADEHSDILTGCEHKFVISKIKSLMDKNVLTKIGLSDAVYAVFKRGYLSAEMIGAFIKNDLFNEREIANIVLSSMPQIIIDQNYQRGKTVVAKHLLIKVALPSGYILLTEKLLKCVILDNESIYNIFNIACNTQDALFYQKLLEFVPAERIQNNSDAILSSIRNIFHYTKFDAIKALKFTTLLMESPNFKPKDFDDFRLFFNDLEKIIAALAPPEEKLLNENMEMPQEDLNENIEVHQENLNENIEVHQENLKKNMEAHQDANIAMMRTIGALKQHFPNEANKRENSKFIKKLEQISSKSICDIFVPHLLKYPFDITGHNITAYHQLQKDGFSGGGAKFIHKNTFPDHTNELSGVYSLGENEDSIY